MTKIHVVTYDALWRIFGYLQARIWRQVAHHVQAICMWGVRQYQGLLPSQSLIWIL
jgi:hypothetical protein